jgi:hypothetical protein
MGPEPSGFGPTQQKEKKMKKSILGIIAEAERALQDYDNGDKRSAKKCLKNIWITAGAAHTLVLPSSEGNTEE